MSTGEQSSATGATSTSSPATSGAPGHPDPRAGPGATATLESSESAERGRSARKEVPRSEHADWAPAPDRPDPVALLAHQAASRVQELVPIRYGRMLVSPFTFYRGAAAVMAADLARTPDSGVIVQSCGDAHIANFGAFAAPDRRLIFSPNDFDETLPGPWEWDVKRMAASAEIAARDVGLPAPRRRRIVTDGVKEYREAMHGFARASHLDVWYERLNASELVARFGGRLGPRGRLLFSKPFAKARRKTSLRALVKLTERVDGELRFRSAPPLLVPLRELFEESQARRENAFIYELLEQYAASLAPDRRHLFATYRFVDMARKVVGVGSVGTRAWVFLFVDRASRDPLILQAKEAQASVMEPYLGMSEFPNHGERVVRGQRISIVASDIFLSWQRSRGLDGAEHDFYVRQLWDWKGSAELSTMSESGLHAYTRACGWSLARMHARSGDRLAIAAYLGAGPSFDRAIARFSAAYADQNERDHDRLVEAVGAGEVQAQFGV